LGETIHCREQPDLEPVRSDFNREAGESAAKMIQTNQAANNILPLNVADNDYGLLAALGLS
jgi:hypothetical protein